MLRVAINGFGRIGRTVLKAGWERPGVEFVAINDLTEPSTLAHLLKYDSVFRTWDHKVSAGKDHLVIDGKKIPVVSQRDPKLLPWKTYQVDVIVESTGRFRNKEAALDHIEAGAKQVVISAPAKGTPTLLFGVNHKTWKREDTVVNNASCTTNSAGPVAEIIHKAFGIKKAMLTTIHSVTAGQNLVDGLPQEDKSDLRRARSGMISMIPTSTGAAVATTEAITSLRGKFDGISVRVPTLDVSLTDFTFLLKQQTTVEKVNALFKKAAKQKEWKGILAVTQEPLVSTDFIGSSYSATVDLSMTRLVDGDLLKVLAWYDNEWGYSVRLMDLVQYVGKHK
ncbi:type I glyceraldehyde-3-phosphate dehydrogenase [Candidatus Uhrbacteria bacterium CG_4_9_14_3_um_filter_36_7]|uniref:Type I glyceraldehyde-3-phosphate dehydrogenase n=1 Tax=Candidatus Uhrbacteria bacterium CG_4_9_14_3_um_filter_36_7 TaxID=1975033 RepID=A0A2M7XI85_9BACT|nr:MAG: type I glyceraldehyde-3-phosphate dehydrogenase [Candidatus Uhrbacteria bacterium CG_4_9_14_3_um_filter_36_7]